MAYIYEITNTTTFGAIPLANVMHIQRTTNAQGTLGGLNAAISKIADFYTQLSSHMPTSSRWIAGSKAVEFQDTAPEDRSALATSGVFQSAPSGTNPLPPTCAVCMNWHTGHPGRSGRGRTFIGPLVSDDLTGGYLNGSVRTSFQTIGQGLISGLNALAEPYDLVVWSRKNSAAYIVNTATTDGNIDTLRSRKY